MKRRVYILKYRAGRDARVVHLFHNRAARDKRADELATAGVVVVSSSRPARKEDRPL